MALSNKRPPKGKKGKKAIRGRLPTKRSINLVLHDEKKISWAKMIPSVLLIIALAAAFSKFLVLDRLKTMSSANARLDSMRAELNNALDIVASYGNVEETYAHMTYDDMTSAELDLVDRTMVMDLVQTLLPKVSSATAQPEDLSGDTDLLEILQSSVVPEDTGAPETVEPTESPTPTPTPAPEEAEPEATEQPENGESGQVLAEDEPGTALNDEPVVNSWRVFGNKLTMDITASSLERLNRLARTLERDPIVNTCVISNANMSEDLDVGENVRAQFIIYLQKPSEEGNEP